LHADSQALSIIQGKAAEKGLQLDTTIAPDVPVQLVGDSHRLNQILVNLLGNAVKFTAAGAITLSVVMLKCCDNRVQLRFSVQDTGIGILPDKQQMLFQPFTQADGSTTRKYGGTGLGLSICKKMVELMGGEIGCNSTTGVGSDFYFTIWFEIGEGSTADLSEPDYFGKIDEQSDSAGIFCGVRLLIAEDNELNRQLVVALLKDTGALIAFAENGEVAVRMVKRDSAPRYDLILMDIQMPVMDGYKATRIIRNDPGSANIPIIAMTAHALIEEQNAILGSGMTDYISKPLDAKQLLEIIGRWLPKDTGRARPAVSPSGSEKTVQNHETSLLIPGLDTTAAVARLGGDTETYNWLVRMFVKSHANAVTEIATLIKLGNFATAGRMVHTIKADCGSIGSKTLWDIAQELENSLVRNEAPEVIRKKFELFSSGLEKLLRQLDTGDFDKTV